MCRSESMACVLSAEKRRIARCAFLLRMISRDTPQHIGAIKLLVITSDASGTQRSKRASRVRAIQIREIVRATQETNFLDSGLETSDIRRASQRDQRDATPACGATNETLHLATARGATSDMRHASRGTAHMTYGDPRGLTAFALATFARLHLQASKGRCRYGPSPFCISST